MKLERTGRKVPLNTKRVATPNDPKLSDGRGWRDGCWVRRRGEVELGKDAARTRRVESQIAASVTAAPVRCSAWLGVDVRFGVGAEVCGTAGIRSERRVARKPKLVAKQDVELPHAIQASPAEATLKPARAKRVKRGLTPSSRLTIALESFIARDGWKNA